MSDQQRPDDQEIRKMLIELHEDLEHAQNLDDDEKAMLRHLMVDIQAMLKRSEAPGARIIPASPSILDRFQQSIDLVEVTHPTLAVAIRKVLDTLTIAGI